MVMPNVVSCVVQQWEANNVSCTISTDNDTLFGLVSSYVELSLEASV